MKSVRNVQEKRIASITEGLLHYLLEKDTDEDFIGIRVCDVPNLVKRNQRIKKMFNEIIPNLDEVQKVVTMLNTTLNSLNCEYYVIENASHPTVPCT